MSLASVEANARVGGPKMSSGLSLSGDMVIRRARTAIQRYRCSKPVAIALADGMISRATSVFDYGCGRGGDVQFLRSKKIQANGWDPHYYPDQSVAPADVVNLGYVLNVIEDVLERTHTL